MFLYFSVTLVCHQKLHTVEYDPSTSGAFRTPQLPNSVVEFTTMSGGWDSVRSEAFHCIMNNLCWKTFSPWQSAACCLYVSLGMEATQKLRRCACRHTHTARKTRLSLARVIVRIQTAPLLVHYGNALSQSRSSWERRLKSFRGCNQHCSFRQDNNLSRVDQTCRQSNQNRFQIV